MGLLKAINKKLNKPAPGAARAVPRASQFVQAARAKANEARDKLRDKPAAKTSAKAAPRPHSQQTPETRKTATTSAPSTPKRVATTPGPQQGVQGRADPVAAEQVSPKGGLAVALAAAKEMREVSAGPRGGKFVQGPEGTKHYVK